MVLTRGLFTHRATKTMWEITLSFNIFISIETLEYELHSKRDSMWCGTAVPQLLTQSSVIRRWYSVSTC